MTELEGQLAAALKTLSAQFRTEQRLRAEERQRHFEELEALQQRIERQDAESAILRQRIERLDDRVTVGPGLRNARRDVARALELMREHIRTRERDRTQDRDFSPGR